MGSCNKNRHNEQTPLHVDKHHSLSILRKKYGILSSLEINAFLYNDTQNLIIKIFKFGSFYGIECFPALLIYLRCLGSLWISALWHIISGFFFFKYIYFFIYTHTYIYLGSDIPVTHLPKSCLWIPGTSVGTTCIYNLPRLQTHSRFQYKVFFTHSHPFIPTHRDGWQMTKSSLNPVGKVMMYFLQPRCCAVRHENKGTRG